MQFRQLHDYGPGRIAWFLGCVPSRRWVVGMVRSIEDQESLLLQLLLDIRVIEQVIGNLAILIADLAL
jgi:hypothetical protein